MNPADSRKALFPLGKEATQKAADHHGGLLRPLSHEQIAREAVMQRAKQRRTEKENQT